jgi:DNA-binding response OmpR family regulator
MDNKAKILIVDDSTENRLLLRMMLEDNFVIYEAESGPECLAMVETNLPDLILLDVNMPEMTGYEVCTRLRSNMLTENLPIIFVSALDSTEERLAGFEAGGDEYVIKPVDGEDLLAKITTCFNRQVEAKLAHQHASKTMNVALEAMSVNSELNQIIDFVKKSHQISDEKQLATAILALCESFNLSASILFIDDEFSFYGCNKQSLEAKFLLKMQQIPDRIISIGIRTLVKSKHIVLLINNMPKDNVNLSKRLSEHLAVIVDIAENVAAKIIAKTQSKHALAELNAEKLNSLKLQILATNNQIKQQHLQSLTLSLNLLSILKDEVLCSKLEHQVEQKIIQLANQTSLQINELVQQTSTVNEELTEITEQITNIMTQ